MGFPVYLTRNGRGRYVVMDIEEYEQQQAEVRLFNELSKAEQSDTWHTVADAKERLGL
jgi:PHD/YefM family antitoxin component YafN of YafNO toxin-antitoxin module